MYGCDEKFLQTIFLKMCGDCEESRCFDPKNKQAKRRRQLYSIFFLLASLFCLYQVSSATDQWECRQGASRTTKSRRHLCGIRSMVLIWQDSIGRVGDDTQGPGQQNTITITSGCKWTLKEQRRSLRYLHRDGRILTSGLHSIMSPGVSTEFTLCHIWKGIALRYEAAHESSTNW